MRIDYNPKIWGPKGWFFLETIILSYPDNPCSNDKLIFKNFFNNLGDILPCTKCRINYKNHILNNPLNDKILNNKDNLINWIVKIHNLSHGKIIDKNKLINYYNSKYKLKNNYIYIILIILFILIILYYYLFYSYFIY